MLASDLNNPEFMNPQNPDSMLFVQFYWHSPLDPNKSAEQGKEVRGEKQTYVRIQKPGDATSIIETPVRDDHKRRWPEKWLYWQMQEGLIDGGREVAGWKIQDWPVLNEDQVRELQYKRFFVVEQIAGASDSQIQALGMGGLGLREQAKKALRERMGAETKDALAAKDAELKEMRERMEKLEAMVMGQAQAKNDAPRVDQNLPNPTIEQMIPIEQEREVLAEKYQEKFGRKAHPNMKIENLREHVNG